MLKGLDHIGVAVNSIDESLPFYRDVLGMEYLKTEEITDQSVRVAFLDVGGVHVELVEPTSPDGAIAKHLEKRGPGLHHLAYVVEDCAAALEELKAKGVKLIDELPRVGAGGKLIAFVHPKATGGVLTEIVEIPRC